MELDPVALEAARLAVEDELIGWRDSGLFMPSGNGFTVNYSDGTPGLGVRMPSVVGLKIAIKKYLETAKVK